MKAREFPGYAYDGAEASFELLARRELDGRAANISACRASASIDERRWNARASW